MIDAMTQKLLKVSNIGTAGPYIRLAFTQLTDLQRVLDEHQVRYSVGENVISPNGGPEVATVNFGRKADPHAIQALLDGEPLASGGEGLPILSARLISRGWLRRLIEVSLPDGTHPLEYYGAGVGYEQVSADGVVIRRISMFWFVPRFELRLGDWPAVLEVRVWPWFAIRSLVVRVGDRIVYAEGEAHWKSKPRLPGDWAELA